MSSTNLKTHHIARGLAPIAAALVLISLGAAPSFARSDPGTHIPPSDHAGGCRLQRVGAQFVRCDSLTGNGVAAPAWIPRAEATIPLDERADRQRGLEGDGRRRRDVRRKRRRCGSRPRHPQPGRHHAAGGRSSLGAEPPGGRHVRPAAR